MRILGLSGCHITTRLVATELAGSFQLTAFLSIICFNKSASNPKHNTIKPATDVATPNENNVLTCVIKAVVKKIAERKIQKPVNNKKSFMGL